MAKKQVERYPLEFRRLAVARMLSSDNICALAEELGVHRGVLYRWRGQLEAPPAVETARSGSSLEDPRDAKLREENNQLKRALADKGLEVDFFRGALQKVGSHRQQSKGSGARAFTTKSGK